MKESRRVRRVRAESETRRPTKDRDSFPCRRASYDHFDLNFKFFSSLRNKIGIEDVTS